MNHTNVNYIICYICIKSCMQTGTGKQWKKCSVKTWQLQVNTPTPENKTSALQKLVSVVLHINNKETKHELKVNFEEEPMSFCSERAKHN